MLVSQCAWAVIAASATIAAVVLRLASVRKSIRVLKPPAAGPDDLPIYKEGDAPFWLSDCTQEAQIHLSKSGIASSKPDTVMQLFNLAVKVKLELPSSPLPSSSS